MTAANDGVFWIQCQHLIDNRYEDFVREYNNLFLCRLLTDSIGHRYKQVLQSSQLVPFEGGMERHNSWRLQQPSYLEE